MKKRQISSGQQTRSEEEHPWMIAISLGPSTATAAIVAAAGRPFMTIRVRLHIIGDARIKNVGKYKSRMVLNYGTEYMQQTVTNIMMMRGAQNDDSPPAQAVPNTSPMPIPQRMSESPWAPRYNRPNVIVAHLQLDLETMHD